MAEEGATAQRQARGENTTGREMNMGQKSLNLGAQFPPPGPFYMQQQRAGEAGAVAGKKGAHEAKKTQKDGGGKGLLEQNPNKESN